MRQISRRKALAAVLGGAAAWGLWRGRSLWSRAGDPQAGPPQANNSPVPGEPLVRTTRALGTEVSITVAAVDAARADRAIVAAFAELREVEAVLSVYEPNSQVSRLARDGMLAEPHRHLTTVLAASLAMARRTAGAFDPSVQPLWDLYSRSAKAGRQPTDDEVNAARRLVDWRAVAMSDDGIRIGPGMALTFNGIAQGYATDRVRMVLAEHGVRHALVDVGELGPAGPKPQGEPWRVGIQHPREPDGFVAMAKLADRCLATSGDYATRFGDRDHHIFDPATGHSPVELASASIVARTAMEADALSTAVFVLGVERGRRLIRETPDADALLVRKDGSTVATEGFPIES